ncbi:hypothetical protein V5E97_06240 [Singulisphaera sp. Ch08]|uniref:Uncharacterized protein n=1 Tax=Singulisphaera sp. Ch08 TaxID=3120278 RepID=A0AAU7CJC9_9BACT
MKPKAESYLYSIQPDQGYFDAGMVETDRQVLMGLFCPDLIIIFFDRAGNLLNHEARHLEFLVCVR